MNRNGSGVRVSNELRARIQSTLGEDARFYAVPNGMTK